MKSSPETETARVALTLTAKSLTAEAASLADKLNLPRVREDDNSYDFLLTLTPERLELREPVAQTSPLFVDFTRGKTAYRGSQQKLEPLARAVGVKGAYKPTVTDATAGLGQDAFVLAAAGCQVTMLERSPIIAALLADGLARAQASRQAALTAANLSLRQGDALELLKPDERPPDTVYLDPMYPASGKSAAKRKSMRVFRQLVGGDTDASELLALALTVANRRVVVKRPLKAPTLGVRKPSSALLGRTTRFDIYLI